MTSFQVVIILLINTLYRREESIINRSQIFLFSYLNAALSTEVMR